MSNGSIRLQYMKLYGKTFHPYSNTKIVSSKANEDKALEKNRYDNHPRGHAISLMKMYQIMLKYPEVYTNMVFENISTMTLDLRAGIKITIKKPDDVTVVYNPEDSAHIGPLSDRICK